MLARLAEEQSGTISQAAMLMVDALVQERKLICCGNGASGANALSFVSKLLNRFEHERPALPALALAPDSITLSALAQDHGWFYDAHRAQVDCHALLQVLSVPLSDGQTGLARLLAEAGQTRYKLRATGAPFETKDKLKSRGYRWDGEGRVWWCSLASDALLDAECAWLRAEVYGTRSARVQLEALNSLVQFSSRSGKLSERSV